ncbi:hypothetical protein FLM48_04360 [Shewanella sp. Scap07]|uniref:hypothetical protein n=1 Tax=Shewanella sp. Scap07 TaxID=2589987 RepID=UPI0015C0F1EC|nr:hypothetical protein [Shewanella sp. Scap07]QLE84387.1 hypothetical protein FLM48_04360 [Shewanella sp. Scap07]
MLLKVAILGLLIVAIALIVRMWLPNGQTQRTRRARKTARNGNQDEPIPSRSALERLPSAATSSHASIHPYHSVAIESEQQCCDAAQKIKKQRFLSAEAPAIPLKECDKLDCHCHYQHFEDRRQPDSDRRSDYGVTQDLYGAFGEQNRRIHKKGRRNTD